MDGGDEPEQPLNLIPGLPDDLGRRVLSMVPFFQRTRLMTTCKSWFSFLSSPSFITSRAHFSFSDHILCIFAQDPSVSSPFLFDYKNLAWTLLPFMPCNPHVYGLSNYASVSIGPNIFVIGGSLFDTRSFPIDRPSPTSAGFKFSFLTSTWTPISPMLCPRGSFACTAIASLGQIVVAGGGSRHALFSAAGSRLHYAEKYDVGEDQWSKLPSLPQNRAGCVGFSVGERDFWVMGGYGNWRTISGVFSVDEYCKNAVVMDVKRGEWREVGDMWKESERAQLGKVVDVEEDGVTTVFMLDSGDIFKYEMGANKWIKETSVPKKEDLSLGFVALYGELHVMSIQNGEGLGEERRGRVSKRNGFGLLLDQIYNPRRRNWRSHLIMSPLPSSLDFKSVVMCTIRL